MKYAREGTISSGTLRNEDLLEAFADELEYLTTINATAWCSDKGRARRDKYTTLVWEAREADPDSDEAAELVEELAEALNEFAPPKTYFGQHEGDGALFGFWRAT